MQVRKVLGHAFIIENKEFIRAYEDSEYKDRVIVETQSESSPPKAEDVLKASGTHECILKKETWEKFIKNVRDMEEFWSTQRGELSSLQRLHVGPTKIDKTQIVESLHHIIQSNRSEESPVMIFTVSIPKWPESVYHKDSKYDLNEDIPAVDMRLETYVLLSALPKELRDQVRKYLKDNPKKLVLHPDTQKEMDKRKNNE